jgi:hypothetical protein
LVPGWFAHQAALNLPRTFGLFVYRSNGVREEATGSKGAAPTCDIDGEKLATNRITFNKFWAEFFAPHRRHKLLKLLRL